MAGVWCSLACVVVRKGVGTHCAELKSERRQKKNEKRSEKEEEVRQWRLSVIKRQ